MTDHPHISDIRFAPAQIELRSTGLMGWICCSLGGEIQLDGIAVRRTVDGRHVISFPCRIDSNGVEHAYIKPLSKGARDAIQAHVIGELRRWGYLS